MKKFEELTMRDHYMFGKICSKKSNCKLILQSLLNDDINVTNIDIEKYYKQYGDGKFVRLDLLAEEDDKRVFNAELQHKSANPEKQRELPKRSRYYQAILDSESLKSGVAYRNLPETFIIFICTFDPFGLGKGLYTFNMICNEIDVPEFNDGVHRLFFNTTGDLSNLPQCTQNMLEYIQTGQPTDDITKLLDGEVMEARLHEEWRRDYMLTLTYKNDIYEEGHDAGFNEGLDAGISKGTISTIMNLYAHSKIDRTTAIDSLSISEAEFDAAAERYKAEHM